MLEGLERVSNLLVRYEILERLYLRVKRETTKNLEECLIRLYVSMLSFLAKAKRFYSKSSTSKCSIDGICYMTDYPVSDDYLRFDKANVLLRACS